MRAVTVACLLFLLFSLGCQERQVTKGNSSLTAGMAKQKIIKGETTQNDIIAVFGSPNIITKNKSDNEVWTYDKVSTDSTYEQGYWTLILAGANGGQSSVSTKTFTLMIEFDNNNVVKDFSYRTSAF